nr:serine/threonine kinase [Pandoravirus massiliensis]
MITPINVCRITQLLHNELISDIPYVLRNKMAYQAAKGMHFLHSSCSDPIGVD